MQVSRRGCLVSIAVLLAVLAVPAWLITSSMVRNNHRLNDWEDALYGVSIPRGSSLLDRGSDFGFLGGNGRHCDFRVWLTLRTDSPLSAVQDHYDQALEDLRPEVPRAFATTESVGRVRVELYDLRSAGWDPRCG